MKTPYTLKQELAINSSIDMWLYDLERNIILHITQHLGKLLGDGLIIDKIKLI